MLTVVRLRAFVGSETLSNARYSVPFSFRFGEGCVRKPAAVKPLALLGSAKATPEVPWTLN